MTVDFRKNGVAADQLTYTQLNGAKGPYPVVEGVNVLGVVQDNARYIDAKGDTKLVYVQFMLHPDDPRAAKQTSLALMESRGEFQGKPRTNYTIGIRPSQFEAMTKAAGDNVTPKLDRAGKETGKVYGFTSSVFPKSSRDDAGKIDWAAPHGVMPIASTMAASELLVGPDANGLDAVTRGFELTAANRAVAQAARAAEKAVEAPVAEVDQPVIQLELT